MGTWEWGGRRKKEKEATPTWTVSQILRGWDCWQSLGKDLPRLVEVCSSSLSGFGFADWGFEEEAEEEEEEGDKEAQLLERSFRSKSTTATGVKLLFNVVSAFRSSPFSLFHYTLYPLQRARYRSGKGCPKLCLEINYEKRSLPTMYSTYTTNLLPNYTYVPYLLSGVEERRRERWTPSKFHGLECENFLVHLGRQACTSRARLNFAKCDYRGKFFCSHCQTQNRGIFPIEYWIHPYLVRRRDSRAMEKEFIFQRISWVTEVWNFRKHHGSQHIKYHENCN